MLFASRISIPHIQAMLVTHTAWGGSVINRITAAMRTGYNPCLRGAGTRCVHERAGTPCVTLLALHHLDEYVWS
jgi:hypothetical protein